MTISRRLILLSVVHVGTLAEIFAASRMPCRPIFLAALMVASTSLGRKYFLSRSKVFFTGRRERELDFAEMGSGDGSENIFQNLMKMLLLLFYFAYIETNSAMFGQPQFRPTLQNFTLVITFARISSLPLFDTCECCGSSFQAIWC